MITDYNKMGISTELKANINALTTKDYIKKPIMAFIKDNLG